MVVHVLVFLVLSWPTVTVTNMQVGFIMGFITKQSMGVAANQLSLHQRRCVLDGGHGARTYKTLYTAVPSPYCTIFLRHSWAAATTQVRSSRFAAPPIPEPLGQVVPEARRQRRQRQRRVGGR